MLKTALELVFALLTLCGLGYYLLVLWAARSFVRRSRPVEVFTPPVTILKPVRGIDPEAFAAFESHCRQDYPDFEIIFGVWDPADSAIAAIEQLKKEFPDRSLRLIVCPEILGTNRKVSNLVQMLPHARHQHLIVNDSDVRVPQDYLRRVVAPFADAKVGMVTALYRGAPEDTLGSELESLGISTDFIGGVLAARVVDRGIRFALGSTLAIRRDLLAQIGGFEALLDYLADDYEMGKRTCDAGFRVELADTVVDTHLPAYSLRSFFEHQLRWARGMRDSRRAGYFGVVLTFGLPWSVFALIAAGGALWAWALFAVTVLARLAVAGVIGRVILRDPHVWCLLWLLPLRDFMALLVWCASYAGHTIIWRGERFRLKDRKLYRVSGSA
ncbi:MAG: bacteriohopanetetrol glucosamine biosynthesis glycosyltransferase HpnI [Acidobacteriia bacterium]|nr:bacteriohopanetetrol glucosamine biosynthesis glycosyltransferase HpnI [Terriglobia bacterium]